MTNSKDTIVAANEVRLVGRVATGATTRELPSGDTVTVLRLVVPRSPRAGRPRGPSSDTLDCAVWSARLRQRAARLAPGTLVEVQGALRRRFWRTPTGPASRYEVEVVSLRRLPPSLAATTAAGP
ncbi:MAG: single-stranded DNA-binding protein [Actinomycetales bacterium]